MTALIALAVVALAANAIFAWQLKQAQKNIADTTRLFEGIVARLTDSIKTEQESARKERQELANRIQAPEVAPIFTPDKLEKQYFGAGDEEEAEMGGWKTLNG